MNYQIKFSWRWPFYVLAILVWLAWMINLQVGLSERYISVDCTKYVDNYPVAIVLGPHGGGEIETNKILFDQLDLAAKLYQKGKIKKIIVQSLSLDSGEDGPIISHLSSCGIPVEDVFVGRFSDDFSMFYRVNKGLSVRRSLIIAQSFYLPRALYLSRNLGLETMGCAADASYYGDLKTVKSQEFLSSLKSWFDLKLGRRILSGTSLPDWDFSSNQNK